MNLTTQNMKQHISSKHITLFPTFIANQIENGLKKKCIKKKINNDIDRFIKYLKCKQLDWNEFIIHKQDIMHFINDSNNCINKEIGNILWNVIEEQDKSIEYDVFLKQKTTWWDGYSYKHIELGDFFAKHMQNGCNYIRSVCSQCIMDDTTRECMISFLSMKFCNILLIIKIQLNGVSGIRLLIPKKIVREIHSIHSQLDRGFNGELQIAAMINEISKDKLVKTIKEKAKKLFKKKENEILSLLSNNDIDIDVDVYNNTNNQYDNFNNQYDPYNVINVNVEVIEFLTKLNMRKYIDVFMENECVTMNDLCILTENDLKEMIKPVCARRKIFNALGKVNNTSKVTTWNNNGNSDTNGHTNNASFARSQHQHQVQPIQPPLVQNDVIRDDNKPYNNNVAQYHGQYQQMQLINNRYTYGSYATMNNHLHLQPPIFCNNQQSMIPSFTGVNHMSSNYVDNNEFSRKREREISTYTERFPRN